MFRIGPLTIDDRVWYIIRGEKGAVTYNYYKNKVTMASIDRHIPVDITEIGIHCEWVAGKCNCDGRSTQVMTNPELIFAKLEAEYSNM